MSRDGRRRSSRRPPERAWPWLLGALYLLVSSLWIVITDRLAIPVTWQPATLQTVKGLLFVAGTTAMLVVLARWALRSLRRERATVDSLVRSSPTAIVAVDRQGRIDLWSPEASRLFGWQPDEVVGRPLAQVLPGALDELGPLFAGDPRDRNVRALPVRHRHRDGTVLDLELSSAAVFDASGRQVGVMALFSDLRPRRAAEERIRLQAAALEAAASAVMLTERDGTILWVNPAFTRLTGFTAEEAVGRSPRMLRSGPSEGTFRELWEAISAGDQFHGRLLNRRKDGTLYLADVSVSPVRDEAGEISHYVAVQEDVSETTRLSDQLRLLASYDPQTGLPNRSLFLDRVRELGETALAYDLSLAVGVAEIAQLRLVRRSLGRAAADVLAREVGRRLQEVAGPSFELSALGGGSFALAWPAPPRDEELPTLLREWATACEAPVSVGGQEIRPRVTFGCAFLPLHGATGEDVVGRAETALAWALDEGEPYRLFEDHLQTSLDERLALEADLERALWQGELLVEYQPVIDLRDDRPAMAEALVRWRHPRHGLLLPGRFLALAEETGHVRRLDQWVLHQAAADLRSDLHRSHARAAVNLSAASLDDDGLLGCLADLRAATGVHPHEIVLEITERTAMRRPERTIALLGDIRALGFRIALDDFGVAYSSLNYLRSLPADYLKLDHSFVRGLGTMSRDERLVRMILSLADDYGLEVIAEGVEEESQLEWLRAAGCRYAQGFLLARPAPLAELLATG